MICVLISLSVCSKYYKLTVIFVSLSKGKAKSRFLGSGKWEASNYIPDQFIGPGTCKTNKILFISINNML